MKKFLSIVLATLMILSVCTACGGNAGKGDGSVTLTWYVPGDKYPDTALVSEELSKITMEKIGCKIDIQFIDEGSFQERMNMNMASSADYDLAFVGYLNTFQQAASKGGLMELDELLKSTPALVEAIPEYIMNSGIYQGKMYAIPNMQITASATAAVVPKDYADEFGLDFSKINDTFDYEPYLEWIKANKPDVFPFRTNWGVSSFRSTDEQTPAGGDFFNFTNNGEQLYSAVKDSENKKFTAVFGYEEGVGNTRVKADKLHEYYKKGWIRQDVDSVLDDTAEHKQKRFGIWFSTYKPGMDGESRNSLGYETVSTRISPVSLGSAAATMIGIGKDCKHPQEAIKFIELINTDKEAYNLVCFGIEGKHYKKVGENRIELIPNSGYNPNASWKFGNQFNAYFMPGQSDTVWEETKELNDLGYQQSLENPNLSTFGFTFVQDDIKTSITKVTEVKNKYNCLRTGSKDPATYWDKMVKEMYDSGLQVIIDEYQKQMDEFLAANPDVIDQIKW
ncbi:MAG: ABC transporter substrate-binding protein [Clostridia bacterium]|nr:ABC transporter substrate-binding protein [Clostridia bacterium]